VKENKVQYRLKEKERVSPMTLSRIQELESLGFEWEAQRLGRPPELERRWQFERAC
jgi:hypothetical protein